MSHSTDVIESLRAHRDGVLHLLVRVLWADERMSARQVEAVSAACELLGEPEPAKLITGRPSRERPLDLPPPVGALALAAAAWVAACDGRTHAAELRLLDRVVEELGLDDATAAHMHIIGLSRATLARVSTIEELERVLRAAHGWLRDRPRAA
jgi:tellurite resistance protein